MDVTRLVVTAAVPGTSPPARDGEETHDARASALPKVAGRGTPPVELANADLGVGYCYLVYQDVYRDDNDKLYVSSVFQPSEDVVLTSSVEVAWTSHLRANYDDWGNGRCRFYFDDRAEAIEDRRLAPQ